MELHYKVYQKVKIYLDKINCALPNLRTLLNRIVFPESEALITSRSTELELMKAQLVAFLLDCKNSLPYVPPCRCKAITSWYGARTLCTPYSARSFKKNLLKADQEVKRQAGYIVSDENAPPSLGDLFERHIERLGKIQERESEGTLNEKAIF